MWWVSFIYKSYAAGQIESLGFLRGEKSRAAADY
jgi:hypothetical protein